MVIKIIVLIVGFLLGFYILRSKEQIVMTFGKMSWAEQKLGAGGTYNVWVIIGLLIMVGSVMYATDTLPFIS